MRRNVVWETTGIMVKGNDHLIQRNTIFDTGPIRSAVVTSHRIALTSWYAI